MHRAITPRAFTCGRAALVAALILALGAAPATRPARKRGPASAPAKPDPVALFVAYIVAANAGDRPGLHGLYHYDANNADEATIVDRQIEYDLKVIELRALAKDKLGAPGEKVATETMTSSRLEASPKVVIAQDGKTARISGSDGREELILVDDKWKYEMFQAFRRNRDYVPQLAADWANRTASAQAGIDAIKDGSVKTAEDLQRLLVKYLSGR